MLTKCSVQRKFSLSAFNSRLITLIVALLVVGISLAFHEPWQDELEAPVRIHAYSWNLLALIDSFRGDGHLPLYHLLVYPFLLVGNKLLGIGVEPIIKLVTFIQYVVLAILTVRWVRFPFSLLFLLSYYPLFEYGTISRCYLLELILLFIIFRSILHKNKTHPLLTVFACFLFPLTDLICVIYSVPLLLYCIIRRHWLKVGALVASYPIAIFFLLPRSEQSYAYAAGVHPSIVPLIQTFVKFTVAAWVPFTTGAQWWNQSFAVKANFFGLVIAVVLMAIVALALLRIYAHDPLLLLACGLGSAGIMAALVLKYPLGAFRHTGFAVWPFLCLLVLLHSLPEALSPGALPGFFNRLTLFEQPIDQIITYAFICILSVQTFSGLAAVAKDINSPFSFDSAQANALNRLLQKTPRLASAMFDYPSGGATAAQALSNWKLSVAPIWTLNDRGCVAQGTSPTPEQAKGGGCPPRIIVTTWIVPLQGIQPHQLPTFGGAPESSLQETLIQAFLSQSAEPFLRERSYRCTQVAAFTHSQTGDTFSYRCRHQPQPVVSFSPP